MSRHLHIPERGWGDSSWENKSQEDGSVEQRPTRLAHGLSVWAELGVAVWGLSQ